VEVAAEVLRRDMIRLNIWGLFRLKPNRIIFLTVFALLFALALIFRPPEGWYAWWAAIVSAAVGGIVVVLAGIACSVLWIVFGSHHKSGVLGKHTYAITEDGFRDTTVANDTVQRWSSISNVLRTKHCLLVQINAYIFYIIPRRSFDDHVEFEEFWNSLRSHWERGISDSAR